MEEGIEGPVCGHLGRAPFLTVVFLAELARSNRVGTIVHFDNPISPEALVEAYRVARGNPHWAGEAWEGLSPRRPRSGRRGSARRRRGR